MTAQGNRMPDTDAIVASHCTAAQFAGRHLHRRAYLHDASSLLTTQFDPGGSDEHDLRNRNYV
jgi:hypothetical protein